MKYAITIEIPDELLSILTAAVQLAARQPPPAAERPEVRPHRPDEHDADEPANVQQAPPAPARPDTPADGPALLSWINRQEHPDKVRSRASGIARSWGYGGLLKQLDGEQAAAVYRELTKGQHRRKWGGQ